MSPQTARDLAVAAKVTTQAAARRFLRCPRGVWARLATRRYELIKKRVAGDLTSPAEVAEHRALDAESERIIALAFPLHP